MAYCEDCGTKMHGGVCPNCHEETVILGQYHEQGMEPPAEDTDFMKKVRIQEHQIDENRAKERNKKRWPDIY